MANYQGVATSHPQVDKLSVAQQLFLQGVAGLTALAGGGQSGATPLTGLINRVLTVATAGDSVLLPAAKAGNILWVKNAHASNSMNVFPNTGDAINALSANSAYAVAATKCVTFVCAVDGTWDTILTA